MHSIIKNNHDKKMKKPLKTNLVRFAFRDTLVILLFFFKIKRLKSLQTPIYFSLFSRVNKLFYCAKKITRPVYVI